MTPRLAAQDLTVTFAGHDSPVIDRLSLAVESGAFVVIVGRSGCGKSTLLNCFAGLLRASAGRVTDNGQEITGPCPRRGVVFQRDVLFPWMTAEANLAFALKAARVPREQRGARIDELLGLVRLDHSTGDRYPYELSGGMRQRVGIARMLTGSPQVMLMDEPFGALDAQTRLRMQDLVTDIWQATGATVVFVTHDVDEAIRLADTIIVLGEHGRIDARIENDLARPRPSDRLADMPGYADLRRTLHHHLDVYQTRDSAGYPSEKTEMPCAALESGL